MLKFWTAQYRYPGPSRLDITVKGLDPFGKFFAPTWGMVAEYKKNPKDQQIQYAYAMAYNQIIQDNYQHLQLLLHTNEQVLVCFCPPGEFCHRHLLAKHLIAQGAEYIGEITDFSSWIDTPITNFKEPSYEFLSNFHPSPFTFQNIFYKTVEHFYQAWKFAGDERIKIAALNTPAQTKNAGKKAQLPWNWDTIKVEIMKEGLKHKFAIPELAKKLKDTGTRKIMEGNYWHDNFWGNCTCPKCAKIRGLNTLGQLLMDIRDKI